MKKYFFFILLSMVVVQGCDSHKTKTEDKQLANSSTDSIQPPGTIIVNKKYDEHGNLVQYDSTYSYFYSLPGGETEQMNPDSFYAQFGKMFHSRYNEWFDSSFNPIFFNDSLFKYDFLNNDFFGKRFELNKMKFDDFFKEIDSLKNEMMNRHYPGGIMKRNE